jgi:hypothetical protein
MKILKFLLLLSLFSCNATKKEIDNPAIPEKVLLKSTFHPSFHDAIHVTVQKNGENGLLIFSVPFTEPTVRDSVILHKEDFKTFFAKLDIPALMSIAKDTASTGKDGINIYSKVEYDHKVAEFNFWSPRRSHRPDVYIYLDAVFRLLREKLPHHMKYIEDIQGYFEYSLPA